MKTTITKVNLSSLESIKEAIKIGYTVYHKTVHSEVVKQKSGTYNVSTLNTNKESYYQEQLSAVILKNGFAGFFIITEEKK
jgi:hypothetical protein